MKRFFAGVFSVVILMLLTAGCSDSGTTDGDDSSAGFTPVLDGKKDARWSTNASIYVDSADTMPTSGEIYDIKNVYITNDTDYLYIAIEKPTSSTSIGIGFYLDIDGATSGIGISLSSSLGGKNIGTNPYEHKVDGGFYGPLNDNISA